MSRRALSPGARSALWVGGGAFVGLAVGALATNPPTAVALSPLWTLAFALYVVAVLALGRREQPDAPAPAPPSRAAPAPVRAAPPPAPAPAPPGRLSVLVHLPDVPDDFPPVMGQGESVQVRVVVRREGAPAEGAAVRLTATLGASRQTLEGVAGTDGAVEFLVDADATGDMRLRAEASLDRLLGESEASLSVVRYEEEIARLFGEFRAYAVGLLGPDAEADTARELADRLRPSAGAEASRALVELARVYELVAYGEREADRRLYLAAMEQLLVLEHADLPQAPPAAPSRGA